MKSSKRGLVVLGAVLAISAILGGLYGPPVRATAAANGSIQDSVKSFTRVLAIVQQNYAEPVDTDKAIYNGAIPAMLRVLDPHSNFFDPEQSAQLREEQEAHYFGVGMSVGRHNEQTMVIAPMVDSPAFKAGIRPGDIVTKVDGKSTEGLDTTAVVTMLKGPRGTTVHITLAREGWDKPIEVTVVRDEIPRPAVDYWTLLRPGVGYVRVTTFLDQNLDSELAAALKQLDLSQLDGLVIDLRNNTGGLLNEAIGMADMFLEKNQLVVTHHGKASPERRYYAVHGNGGLHIPLVVLINGQSASASEVVAGAIQDHDRGLVVGETSFGKGLVQSAYPLSNDTALWLITAKYYTPTGRLIQRDYKNVSNYEYRFNPQPPKNPEVKLTDSGRQVFGGGGITPDVVDSAQKYNNFQQVLLTHGVLYPFDTGVGDFTRSFLGEKPNITHDFTVDDAIMHEFRLYLDKQHIRYTEPEMAENLSWIKGRIKREVLTSAFNVNEGYKVLLLEDPQVQKAIELLPQAKALYDGARKVLAQHQAAQLSRPN